MTGATILAIDLGKYKCVSCTYDKVTAAAEFRTVTTSRAEVERLIRGTAPAVVVIEACTLAGWVSDLCGELGVPVKVANTAAEAWKYKHTKRKSDRDDALRPAQLEALGQLPTVVVPAKRVREWRALIAHRQALVAQRVNVEIDTTKARSRAHEAVMIRNDPCARYVFRVVDPVSGATLSRRDYVPSARCRTRPRVAPAARPVANPARASLPAPRPPARRTPAPPRPTYRFR